MQRLLKRMSRQKWIYFGHINVRSVEETENCYITDMCTVSDTDIVAIDQNNKSVKIVDVYRKSVRGCLKFESIPFSVTRISNKQVCVTFQNASLVRIFDVREDGLDIVRTFPLNGLLVAVAYSNGKLFVSYRNPAKFEILNIDGSVARRINIDEGCLKICSVPRYFKVSSDEKRIYVTDLTRDVVLCMDIDGKLINSYAEENLDQPHALTTLTSDEVYLTNRNSHTVMKFDKNLNKATTILTKLDGLKYPTAMCFSLSDQSLYISSASTKPEVKNSIRIYSSAKTFEIENIWRK